LFHQLGEGWGDQSDVCGPTSAGFGGRSKTGLRTVERQRVHALFDEIQTAIYNDDRARFEVLMVKLVLATARHRRTN
jgi:hypothetical protein